MAIIVRRAGAAVQGLRIDLWGERLEPLWEMDFMAGSFGYAQDRLFDYGAEAPSLRMTAF